MKKFYSVILLAGALMFAGVSGKAWAQETLTLQLSMGPVVIYKPLKVSFSSLANPSITNGITSIMMTVQGSRTGQLEVKLWVRALTNFIHDPETGENKMQTTFSVDSGQPMQLTDPYSGVQEMIPASGQAAGALIALFNSNFTQPSPVSIPSKSSGRSESQSF